MTPDDRVIDLLERANPVPDPDGVAMPTSAQSYLRRLETRSSTMTLTAVEPDAPAHAPNNKKPWLMIAAAVVALALIAGLIIAGTRSNEDQVPVDEPDPTVPAVDPEPEADADPDPEVTSGEPAVALPIALDLPVTVRYLDLEFELQGVRTSPQLDPKGAEPDDDPENFYVHATIEATNPMTDHGFRQIPQRTLVWLDVPAPGLEPIDAVQVWDGSDEQANTSFTVEPGQTLVRTWSFPVPVDTDVSAATLVVNIDAAVAREEPELIAFAGPAPVEPFANVALDQTMFGGTYGPGTVDFKVTQAFASLNRGVYPDGRARPGQSDRRALAGEVFVVVELQATATDDPGGIEPGEHVIVADDGTEFFCQNDAPETFGPAPVVYTASCAVPLTATSYTFQMSSDKTPDGEATVSVDHAIVIDPSFVAEFE